MSAALEFHGVVKRYGRRCALDGLDFAVPAGGLCGLVGANGAGKTTALAVAAGLARVDAGAVRVLGGGPFDPARTPGRLTLLPQDAELPREARPGELLAFYGRTQGMSAAAARAEAARLLDAVHLSDRAGSPLRALSHGMRKRLMIAQCFLGAPELILLDEPISGLDPREARRARDLIAGLRGASTVIVSSHDLHELERLCDHVVFMDRGRCLRAGALDEVTRRAEQLVYRLAGAPPVDLLVARVADAAFEWDTSAGRLVCRFARGRPPWEINAAVLPVLLEAGVGILGIEPGERLEAEYLALDSTPGGKAIGDHA
jgi:ABC-2 type transport system ATP-binding protein